MSYQFTCSFIPSATGYYRLSSPYFLSSSGFRLLVHSADLSSSSISSAYSFATVEGDASVQAGSMVEILVELRNNLNQTYNLTNADGCNFQESNYKINGLYYSFTFQSSYPYLRTMIYTSGIASFSITITCSSLKFSLTCLNCTKLVTPLTEYSTYQIVTLPEYPREEGRQVQMQNQTVLFEGDEMAFGIVFYDVFGN